MLVANQLTINIRDRYRFCLIASLHQTSQFAMLFLSLILLDTLVIHLPSTCLGRGLSSFSRYYLYPQPFHLPPAVRFSVLGAFCTYLYHCCIHIILKLFILEFIWVSFEISDSCDHVLLLFETCSTAPGT